MNTLKEIFDSYFLRDKIYKEIISNNFQQRGMINGLSIIAKEELIKLFDDSSLKMSFNQKNLIKF